MEESVSYTKSMCHVVKAILKIREYTFVPASLKKDFNKKAIFCVGEEK